MALRLRNYHEGIIEATTAFSASLAFNLALTELCEQFGRHICLLIDEFDELYIALDDRALLNLRALRDRFKEQLTFVTATVRSLPELRRRDIEDEFAEMFTQTTYTMPVLDHAEAETILDEMRLPGLTRRRRKQSLELSGGHPGLLVAAGQVLAALPDGWEGDPAWAVAQEPQPRAECLKIWNQLTEAEQSALLSFAMHSDVGPTTAQVRMLEGLGLVKRGQLFSPVFADFIARRGRKRELTSTGVHLDPDGGDVYVDGIRIPVLTDLEFRLLALLDERRDRLTDKYQIVTAVWGENFLGEVDDARVEKLVSRLRSKIEADPANPRYLITQRGRGYKLLSKPATPTGSQRGRKRTPKDK
jgi:DNA-binding winged helix-turn-helix (wHTH) protein